jgi:hypothetical protein
MTYVALTKKKKNSPAATLTVAASSTDDTLTVDHLEYFHDDDGNLIAGGIVLGYDNSNDILPERVTITAASTTAGAGTLIGVTRGVDSDGPIGAANAWASGTKLAVMGLTDGDWNQIGDNFAAAVGTWAAFDATPVWPDNTPTISSTVARYVRNGNVVTFGISYVISEGNDAASPSIPLPVAASQIANYKFPLIGFKKITSGGTSLMSDPFAYVDFTEATPTIKFHQFGTLPSGYTAELRISGSYEVTT